MLLEVVKFEVTEPFTVAYDVGETYTYLKDTKTGKYYQLNTPLTLELNEFDVIEASPLEDDNFVLEVIEG